MNSSVELLVLRQRCFDSEIHLVAHFFIYFFMVKIYETC